MVKYAVTISPDPKWIVARKPIVFYRHLDVKCQHRKLDWEIRQAVKFTQEKFDGVLLFNGYYELNKSGQLHCHGILDCTEEQMEYFQQWIYDEVGRMTFKNDTVLKNICCNVQLLDHVNKYRRDNGLISWEEYMMKDQKDNWRKKCPEIYIGFNCIVK